MIVILWWTFIGGLLASAMIAGPIYSNPMSKKKSKALMFLLLGPAMWSVLAASLVFGVVMALVHKYNAAAKKG